MGRIDQASIQSYFQRAFNVIMKPSVEPYQAEARNANWNSVMIGVGSVTAVTVVVAIIRGFIGGATAAAPFMANDNTGSSTVTGALAGSGAGIVAAIVSLIFVPLFFFCGAGILWLSAKIFGGQGQDFLLHSYLLSLSYTPTHLVIAALGLISIGPLAAIIGLVGLVLRLYQIYHAGLSMQVSQRMEPGKAQLAAWVPTLIGLALLCVCAVVALLAGAAFLGNFARGTTP
jgi:hypothetical protein